MYSQKIYLIFIDLTFTFCFFKLELERNKKKKKNNIDSTVLAFFFKLIYFVFSSQTCFIYQTPKLYKRRPLGFTEEAADSVETLVSRGIMCPVDVKTSVSLESMGTP